jgi:hypothetical protein
MQPLPSEYTRPACLQMHVLPVWPSGAGADRSSQLAVTAQGALLQASMSAGRHTTQFPINAKDNTPI